VDIFIIKGKTGVKVADVDHPHRTEEDEESMKPGWAVEMRRTARGLQALDHSKLVSLPHSFKKDDFTTEEVELANRCHGQHLEGLNLELTPAGMHYLLIHFDVPTDIDEGSFRLKLRGLVDRPLDVSMADIRKRPRVSIPVTMECAGNGRINMKKRSRTVSFMTLSSEITA
jgi:hypothetical protein